MTDPSQDPPIVSVCVVTDSSKCPVGYTLVDKTYDGKEDADLWRDGLLFGRRCRYLCLEKAAPTPNQNVLVDVTIINEKDTVPPGFTVLEYTADTNEKTLKKKSFCVRWMRCQLTGSAISELIVLNKGVRRPPNGFTITGGDLNNMCLCYKMSPLVKPENNKPEGIKSYTPNTIPSATMTMTPWKQALPYPLNPTEEAMNHNQAWKTEPTTAPGSRLVQPTKSPLSDVPWQLNPRFQEASQLQNVTIPEILCKTMLDLDNQYNYQFRLERSAAARSYDVS